MERHGEVPPWKAGKKKPSSHTPSAFPTAASSEAPCSGTSIVVKDEQTTSTQTGLGQTIPEVATSGSNRVVKPSTTNKRKRGSKAAINLEIDDLDCGTRDAMLNPGLNPTKYRRIAPAPPIAPLARGTNMEDVGSDKAQKVFQERQPCPPFIHQGMHTAPLALVQSPLPFQEFDMSTDPQWPSLGLGETLPPMEYSTAGPNAQFLDEAPHGLSLTGTELLMGQHLQGQISEYSGFHLGNTSVMSPNTAVPFMLQAPSPHSNPLGNPRPVIGVSSCLENSEQVHETSAFPCDAMFAVGSSFEPMSFGLENGFWESFEFLGEEDKLA